MMHFVFIFRQSLLEEDAEYKDFETSEPSLKLLENRIQAFNIKYGMGQKTKNLPQLKRFKLDVSINYYFSIGLHTCLQCDF